jgi:PKD repeat protein
MKTGEKVAVGLLVGAAAVGVGAGIYFASKVQAQGEGPLIDFTASSNGLRIQCYDLSTKEANPAYSWDFGDGIGNSVSKNPSYTYAAPGTYRITFRVTNADGKFAETWANITVRAVAGLTFAHPEFHVGDIIQKINGSPADPYAALKITRYVVGTAPYYGNYVTILLSGPRPGGTALFWVKDIDGYYHKIG